MWRRPLLLGAALLVAGFIALQLVPYGRDHDNPPVRAEPTWDSPRTRMLAVRACFDCHSNETRWPWYSNIAPMSWQMQRDVEEGRRSLNFSEWDRRQSEADDAAETIEDGEMPPLTYLLAHPEARLSAAESAELVRGLEASVGDEDDRRGRNRGRGSDDD